MSSVLLFLLLVVSYVLFGLLLLLARFMQIPSVYTLANRRPGQASGMSWLKNAYDLCKQFPIHCPQPSPTGLVLQLRVGIPSWDASKYVSVCVSICIWIGCIKIFYGLWCAKVTLCRGRAISEVCVCDFRLSLHVLLAHTHTHMTVS